MCTHSRAHVSGGQGSLFFPSMWGSQGSKQVVGLGSKYLYPLSYLTGPINLFLRQDHANVSQAVFKPAIFLPHHLECHDKRNAPACPASKNYYCKFPKH